MPLRLFLVLIAITALKLIVIIGFYEDGLILRRCQYFELTLYRGTSFAFALKIDVIGLLHSINLGLTVHFVHVYF